MIHCIICSAFSLITASVSTNTLYLEHEDKQKKERMKRSDEDFFTKPAIAILLRIKKEGENLSLFLIKALSNNTRTLNAFYEVFL